MKGLIRKVDDLGRIVIPSEIRKVLSIGDKDYLEIMAEERSEKTVVILNKYCPGCIFCNMADDCIIFKDNFICCNCLEEIRGVI